MFGATLVLAHASLVCELTTPSVTESSGLAAARNHHGVFWTHNDSGDDARLFAFDLTGTVRSELSLRGITAIDWEDMACAKVGGRSYLYIGDVGDNARRRETITIYRVPEPTRLTAKQVASKFDTYVVTYPDGAKDCEALIVTRSGDIQIITKDAYGDSGVYVLRRPSRSGQYKLQRLGDLKVAGTNVYSHQITGADMNSADEVIVRTYFTAFLYPGGDGNNWYRRTPRPVTIALERQGEAVCFDPTRRRALTSSEGSPCRVSEASLPTS